MQTEQRPVRPPLYRLFISPRAAASLSALALVCGAITPAAAAKAKEDKPAYVSKATHKKAGKVKFANGSGETTAERDRRLLRECKGRPNAGACLGYTG